VPEKMTAFDLEIKHLLFTAMLFNIPEGLKRLSYALTETSISVLAVFDAEPQAFQKDCIYSIFGELNGHLINELQGTIEFKVEGSVGNEINREHLLFARYDGERY
jgi:hypothetical protein